MEGLDGRHRDKNGQIERKHGNTKMRTLKPEYPELKNFRNDDTLGQVARGTAWRAWTLSSRSYGLNGPSSPNRSPRL